MRNKIGDLMVGALILVCGVVVGYFISTKLHETIALTILVVFFILLVGIFLLFKWDVEKDNALETAQDALVSLSEKINKSIGAHSASLKQSLKEGTDHLSHVAAQHDQRAQYYHSRHKAYVGLVKYHIYAAAIKSLHQTRNAEKADKFIKKELEVLEKIEAGEDVFVLCGDRAHKEEQALSTLQGRIVKGGKEPKTAFLRCKSCGGEFEACPNCGGGLERRFK